MSDTEIFRLAVKLPLDQRAAYLDQACGSNDALRREVESLLRAHEESESFLERPAVRAAATERQPITEGPGSVIGPYKLIEQIGDGGFGVVFRAEQQHPVRRTVALKILKPGMDTRQVVARFEAERQALALMDHPNIARVLDGGETATGRPYFVMELVKGIPISQYCDEHQLTPRERLALFVEVCQAIQHAHQKGIIHRDLKPSNVLVAAYDGKPVPKVIDFGVAKAIGAGLTERTQLTDVGAIIGTLEYMSPEQAEFNAVDVDTRSDVYSLGVLLYELLTGTTPLTKERLKQAAITEALRLIREEDPPRPSTRLSDSKELLASISAQRRSEPARLTKEVRGELDWIVMKALDKDRSRRYETAIGFAQDLQRYLADEPVEACPPSALYRMRKFARRHKKALATVTAFLVLLLTATVTSLVLASWALREKQAAQSNEKVAQARAEEIRAVLDFVDHRVFAAGRPLGEEGGLGRDVTLRRAIESALPHVEGSFPDQPLVEARLLMTIGSSFNYLGEPKRAERLFRRAVELRTNALGPHDAETLRSRTNLGRCLHIQGRFKEATDLQEETLRIQEATLGADHHDTLKSMGNLAITYGARARISQAADLFEKTWQGMKATLGDDHPDTIRSMFNLATHIVQKRPEEACKLHDDVFRRCMKKHGADHPDTLRAARGLGEAYTVMGLHSKALNLLDDTLRRQEAILSRDHPNTLRTMHTLAQAHAGLGRPDEALTLFQEAFERRKATLGPGHLDTLTSLNALANYYATLGRHAEAAKLREGLRQPPAHPPGKKAHP